MTYVKTHWINNEEPSIDADNLNHMEQGIEDAQYPDGGSAGQLLAKTTNGTEWVDAPNSAVWGLIQGQLNEQEDLYAELESKIVAPASGTTGQYLRKTAGGTEWADAGSIDTVNNISPDANKNVQTVIELTQAQYNALANPDPNVTYLITDGINNPANNTINSRGVSYDNTDSGLTATTVQGAIDENASAIEELNNGLTPLLTSPLLCWRGATTNANWNWRSGIYGTDTSTVDVNDYGVLIVISNADRAFDGSTWYFQILITTSGVIKFRESINQTDASGWTAWKTVSLS